MDPRDIPSNGEVMRADDPDSPSTRYGDWENVKKSDAEPSDYFFSNYMGGSDYSGTLVERSNARVFLEEFGDLDGVIELHGGHGTFAVGVRLDVLASNEGIQESFGALENYPLLSDDDHSQMEMEAQNEAWKDWAHKDFLKAMRKHLGDYIQEMLEKGDPDEQLDIDVEDLAEAYLDSLSEEDVQKLFYETSDSAGEYWTNEQGDTAWIDVEKIAKKVDDSDYKEMAHNALKDVVWPSDTDYRGPPDPNQMDLPGVKERRRR